MSELPDNSTFQDDLYKDRPKSSSEMPNPGPQTTLASTIPSNRVSNAPSHPSAILQRAPSTTVHTSKTPMEQNENVKPTLLLKKYSDGGGGINVEEIMQQAKKSLGSWSMKDLEEKMQQRKSEEVTSPPWAGQLQKGRVSITSGEGYRSTTQEEKSELEMQVSKFTHNDSAFEDESPSGGIKMEMMQRAKKSLGSWSIKDLEEKRQQKKSDEDTPAPWVGQLQQRRVSITSGEGYRSTTQEEKSESEMQVSKFTHNDSAFEDESPSGSIKMEMMQQAKKSLGSWSIKDLEEKRQQKKSDEDTPAPWVGQLQQRRVSITSGEGYRSTTQDEKSESEMQVSKFTHNDSAFEDESPSGGIKMEMMQQAKKSLGSWSINDLEEKRQQKKSDEDTPAPWVGQLQQRRVSITSGEGYRSTTQEEKSESEMQVSKFTHNDSAFEDESPLGGIKMEMMQQAKTSSGSWSIKDLEEKRQQKKSDEDTPAPWVGQLQQRRVSITSGEGYRSTTQEEKSESEMQVSKFTHNDSAFEDESPLGGIKMEMMQQAKTSSGSWSIKDLEEKRQQKKSDEDTPAPWVGQLQKKKVSGASGEESRSTNSQEEKEQKRLLSKIKNNELPAPKPKLVPVQKTIADPPAEGAAGHSRPPPKPVGRTALPQVPFIEQNKSTATDHPTEDEGSNDNLSPPLGPKSSDTPTKEVTPKTEKPHPPLKPKVSVKLNEVIDPNSQSSPKLPPKPSVGPNDTEQKALPVVLPSLSDNPSSDKSSDTLTKEVRHAPKASVKLNKVMDPNSQSLTKLPPRPSDNPNDTEQKALPVVLVSLLDNHPSDKHAMPTPPEEKPSDNQEEFYEDTMSPSLGEKPSNDQEELYEDTMPLTPGEKPSDDQEELCEDTMPLPPGEKPSDDQEELYEDTMPLTPGEKPSDDQEELYEDTMPLTPGEKPSDDQEELYEDTMPLTPGEKPSDDQEELYEDTMPLPPGEKPSDDQEELYEDTMSPSVLPSSASHAKQEDGQEGGTEEFYDDVQQQAPPLPPKPSVPPSFSLLPPSVGLPPIPVTPEEEEEELEREAKPFKQQEEGMYEEGFAEGSSITSSLPPSFSTSLSLQLPPTSSEVLKSPLASPSPDKKSKALSKNERRQLKEEEKIRKEKEKEERKKKEAILKNKQKCLKGLKQFALTMETQPLFAVELLQDHPNPTKEHIAFMAGEVATVLLMTHEKLPKGNYIVEKSDGTVGYVDRRLCQRTSTSRQCSSSVVGSALPIPGDAEEAIQEDIYESVGVNEDRSLPAPSSAPPPLPTLPPPTSRSQVFFPPPSSPKPPLPREDEQEETYEDLPDGQETYEDLPDEQETYKDLPDEQETYEALPDDQETYEALPDE